MNEIRKQAHFVQIPMEKTKKGGGVTYSRWSSVSESNTPEGRVVRSYIILFAIRQLQVIPQIILNETPKGIREEPRSRTKRVRYEVLRSSLLVTIARGRSTNTSG